MPTCLAITLCIVSLVAIWFRSSCLLGQLIMLKIHTVVVRLLPIPEIRGSNPVIGKFLSIINCIEKTKIKKKTPGKSTPPKKTQRDCAARILISGILGLPPVVCRGVRGRRQRRQERDKSWVRLLQHVNGQTPWRKPPGLYRRPQGRHQG